MPRHLPFQTPLQTLLDALRYPGDLDEAAGDSFAIHQVNETGHVRPKPSLVGACWAVRLLCRHGQQSIPQRPWGGPHTRPNSWQHHGVLTILPKPCFVHRAPTVRGMMPKLTLSVRSDPASKANVPTLSVSEVDQIENHAGGLFLPVSRCACIGRMQPAAALLNVTVETTTAPERESVQDFGGGTVMHQPRSSARRGGSGRFGDCFACPHLLCNAWIRLPRRACGDWREGTAAGGAGGREGWRRRCRRRRGGIVFGAGIDL